MNKDWDRKRKYVRKNYLSKTINEMVIETGMHRASIYKMRRRMGIKKDCICGCGKRVFWDYVNHHKKPSRKTILKRKNSRKGYKVTKETKEKISGSLKGKLKGISWDEKYGEEKTEELKKKLSKRRKGKNFEELYGKKKADKMKKDWKERRKKMVIPVKDTKIEVKIQNFLKELGITFFTHQYIKEIEHGYQCDILIPSINLVIECDGDYWHKYPIGREIDDLRTKELIQNGFKVLRLWECDIKKMNLGKFENKIGVYK